jgi:hypothetical protein
MISWNSLYTNKNIQDLFLHFKNSFQLSIAELDKPFPLYNHKFYSQFHCNHNHSKDNISNIDINESKCIFKDSQLTYIYPQSNADVFHMYILTNYFLNNSKLTNKNKNKNENKNQNQNNTFELLLNSSKKNISNFENIFVLYQNIFQFKNESILPFVSLSLFCTFKPRNILDLYPQNGQNLLGTISYQNANYFGLQSNKNKIQQFSSMLNLFIDPAHNNKEYHFGTFSDLEKKNNKNKNKNKKIFDLILVSPKSFSIQNYKNKNKKKKNSSQKFDQWINELYENIDKSWEYLESGGFMILTLNDFIIYQKENPVKYEYVLQLMKHILQKNGAKFINLLKYQMPISKNLYPIWIFQKLDNITINIFNKPYIISTVNHENKNFHIIREDLLISGAKQRMMYNTIPHIPHKRLFYRGPENGYSGLALSYACTVFNKQAYVILNKPWSNKMYIVSKVLKIFGGNIIYIDKPNENIGEDDDYVVHNILEQYEDSYAIPKGFHEEAYMNENRKALIELKNKIGDPKRFWIVTSSGTILDTLLDIFPKTKFLAVFVGHVRPDYLENERIQWYVAPESFHTPTKVIPPYPTELTYDGKVWQFVIEYGEDGDYIYNVGGLC